MATHQCLASPLLSLALGTFMAAANAETAAVDSHLGNTHSSPSPVDHAPASEAGTSSVWVELDAPALSSLHGASKAAHEALRQRISAQQDETMLRLKQLGAVEQSRIQVLRNALAVRIPLQNIQAARRLVGVRSVKEVHDKTLAPPAPGHQ
jgi:hypothetical protein